MHFLIHNIRYIVHPTPSKLMGFLLLNAGFSFISYLACLHLGGHIPSCVVLILCASHIYSLLPQLLHKSPFAIAAQIQEIPFFSCGVDLYVISPSVRLVLGVGPSFFVPARGAADMVQHGTAWASLEDQAHRAAWYDLLQ